MNGFKFNCVKHNICKEKSNYHDDRFVDVKFRSSYENIKIYVKMPAKGPVVMARCKAKWP